MAVCSANALRGIDSRLGSVDGGSLLESGAPRTCCTITTAVEVKGGEGGDFRNGEIVRFPLSPRPLRVVHLRRMVFGYNDIRHLITMTQYSPGVEVPKAKERKKDKKFLLDAWLGVMMC